MIKVENYTLPDIAILDSENPDYHFFVWQPDKVYLVLGQSNKAEKSLYIDKVVNDSISVLKRPSGGETVILTPNTLVISTTVREEKIKNPKIYFNTANKLIIKTLEKLGVKDLSLKGISDIAIGNKKILGSSIYRKSGKVFYQSVLNVSEKAEIIEKYIRHPEKEPDYRMGRNHAEFVTSVQQAGFLIPIENLIQGILQIS
jgi:lipoate---protein ligase